MNVRKKSYSVLFTILSCVAILSATLSAIMMYRSSVVDIESGSDEYNAVYVGNVWNENSSFEDSAMLAEMFMDRTSEITRMCAIKGQMETNGQYDPDKVIDVVEFAERNNPYSENALKDVAEYRLDDLIKWDDYGFEVIPLTGTRTQINAAYYSIFNNMEISGAATMGEPMSVDYHQALNLLDGSYNTDNVGEEEETVEYILADRFKTVDKKSLKDCVSDYKSYRELAVDIIKTAEDLSYNYGEYVRLNDKYDTRDTNMFYCYQMVSGDGGKSTYTNVPSSVSISDSNAITSYFMGLGKYAYFDVDRLSTTSNIEGINSVYMRDEIMSYGYAFGEGSKVWLAIDTGYPVNDEFKKASVVFANSSKNFIPSLVVFSISAAAYLVLLILGTVFAGRRLVINEDCEKTREIRPLAIDRMPVELYIIIASAVFCGILLLSEVIYSTTREVLTDWNNYVVYYLWGILAVAANAALFPLYLVLVRKIKCKLMWKGCLLQRVLSKIKGGIVSLYDNGHLVVRVWLPYLLFLVVNLVLVLLGDGGIAIAFILDIVLGYFLYREARTRNEIVSGISRIAEGDIDHKVDTEGKHGDNLALANAVNNIGEGISKAVSTSMRDERMKADLITNVSHDIKTPLTSIINYVDLLKRGNIQDEKIRGYVDILDQKSQRLKQLTDDLVEASKISSGSIALSIEKINFVELVHQILGEFSEKFEEKGLKTVAGLPSEPVYIRADSRGIYRVMENLYNNVYKYALEGTRVYVDLVANEGKVEFSVKNISLDPLNISADELTERFIRGDVSRGTEGSGLGLSIAKSLTTAMGGSFDVYLDGDLFKVVVGFPILTDSE